MDVSFVYITAANRDEAVGIGRVLVEERLVACVNVLEPMTSLYWWEGALQEDAEAVLIAKTQTSLVVHVVERVKTLHSYSCPCIVSWPLTAGNKAYFDWIHEETHAER